ncbi:MAG: hypothetical protein P1U47_01580 [Zhongshania sp.]|uniref:hypothetical protein n=1 Tax=Zhongshania sp. TaxID=1971902 RepID=UPI00260A8A35|nr:hypothetical protein [Zhongshania sp.]MDF1691037.1 hypothetical protein [Zhongshania sp.]
MSISVQEAKNPKRKKGRQSLEQRFNAAWQRLIKQQQKNMHLQAEIRQFAEEVERRIGAQEQRCNAAQYRLIEHLMKFYTRKSLPDWQREALLDWIYAHFQTLSSNPFAGDLDLVGLQKKIGDVIVQIHPEFLEDEYQEPDTEPSQGHKNHKARAERSGTEDMFADLFTEFDRDEDDDEFLEQEELDLDALFEEFFQERHLEEEQDRKNINQFLKTSAINKMFRQIVKVLHPDREQDPEQRELKNQLMAELVSARDDNDIPKIFSLYHDHVGESPLGQLKDKAELEKVTMLLQRQYEFLRDDERQIFADNPRDGIIYQRFFHSRKAKVDAGIKQHLLEIEQLCEEQALFVTQITSLSKLKPFLEARFNQQYDEDDDEDWDNVLF